IAQNGTCGPVVVVRGFVLTRLRGSMMDCDARSAFILARRSSPFDAEGYDSIPIASSVQIAVSAMLRYPGARHVRTVFSLEHCRYSPSDFKGVSVANIRMLALEWQLLTYP